MWVRRIGEDDIGFSEQAVQHVAVPERAWFQRPRAVAPRPSRRRPRARPSRRRGRTPPFARAPSPITSSEVARRRSTSSDEPERERQDRRCFEVARVVVQGQERAAKRGEHVYVGEAPERLYVFALAEKRARGRRGCPTACSRANATLATRSSEPVSGAPGRYAASSEPLSSAARPTRRSSAARAHGEVRVVEILEQHPDAFRSYRSRPLVERKPAGVPWWRW